LQFFVNSFELGPRSPVACSLEGSFAQLTASRWPVKEVQRAGGISAARHSARLVWGLSGTGAQKLQSTRF
jgi:hypothetical protein